MESVPGVGRVTATALLAQLPKFGKLSNKQISGLVGVCPYNHDSGTLRNLGRARQRACGTVYGGFSH